MENHKKRKYLVRCTTTNTNTNTVCAPESSAPVAKRRKQHSVDKDLSSASHVPLAKPRPRRFRRGIPRPSRRGTGRSTDDICDRPSARRMTRRRMALYFLRGFNLSSVFRFRIGPGVRPKKRQATSFGIPWAAVHGKNWMCVVARRKDVLRLEQDLETSRVKKNTKYFLTCFWNALISEVEGEHNTIRKRPFGVVSVIKQDSNKKVHKASRAKYDVEKAIEFLREEMESGAVFTFDKTTQTAISAFQHLFGKEFEADEIQAFVVECNRRRKGRELKQSREDFDIEEIQAIINGDGDGAGA